MPPSHTMYAPIQPFSHFGSSALGSSAAPLRPPREPPANCAMTMTRTPERRRRECRVALVVCLLGLLLAACGWTWGSSGACAFASGARAAFAASRPPSPPRPASTLRAEGSSKSKAGGEDAGELTDFLVSPEEKRAKFLQGRQLLHTIAYYNLPLSYAI